MPSILEQGSFAKPVYIVGPDGEMVNLAGLLQQLIGVSGGGSSSTSGVRDTAGNEVPVWRSRTFAYDPSGNLSTETIATPLGTWVKTYTYSQGNQIADSGWVKQ